MSTVAPGERRQGGRAEQLAMETTTLDRLAAAREAMTSEAEAVRAASVLLDASFERAVQLVLDCTGSVIVAGIGKSGLIGAKLAATLASTGTPSHFLHATEAAHGDLGRVRRGDVVLLLSYSGGTEEVVALAALLRQDGVPTIGISRSASTHLGGLVSEHLSVGDVAEACPHRLAPTSSTAAMLALGDALAMVVSKERAFSAEDFGRRHPGGALGRTMLPLLEIMRQRVGESLEPVRAVGSVGDVLGHAERSGGSRRPGAVLLVDDAGGLAGILTDADVRRRLVSEGDAVLDRPIAEVMTASPRSLPASALVRDAVQLVREVRLDEIPVVDDDGRPVGLIDVQDLLAMKLVDDR
ncbi:MAG: KpsF/GutQ family sugar-phosphate isomerase [Planctomycetota bacterium]